MQLNWTAENYSHLDMQSSRVTWPDADARQELRRRIVRLHSYLNM